MTTRTCKVLGMLMLACGVVALWFSFVQPYRDDSEFKDSVTRLRDTQDEQVMMDERDRRVAETIAIIECRRHASASECASSAIGQPGGHGCRRTVLVDGFPRSRNCNTG